MGQVLRFAGMTVVALVGIGFVVAVGARFHDGPIGPFAGGPFRGAVEVGSEPDWTFLDGVREIELQVNASAPRTIHTWVVTHGGVAYVPAGFAARKRWPTQVEADGRVVLRARGRLYERQATRVRDPGLVRALLGVLSAKYGGTFEDSSATWFFRLDPPPPTEASRGEAAAGRAPARAVLGAATALSGASASRPRGAAGPEGSGASAGSDSPPP
jgi:hypothetical protein